MVYMCERDTEAMVCLLSEYIVYISRYVGICGIYLCERDAEAMSYVYICKYMYTYMHVYVCVV